MDWGVVGVGGVGCGGGVVVHMWTHKNKISLKGVVFSIKMSICLHHTEKPWFPVWKKTLPKSKVCACVTLLACACLYTRTLENARFHIPTYHAQFCVHASPDVIVLMMIMMMVFIYLWRWKKGRWQVEWEQCQGLQRAEREPGRARERGRGRVGKRGE